MLGLETILGFLGSAWDWRRLIVPALAIVAGIAAFAYISHLRADRARLTAANARLEASLSVAEQAARDNAAAVDRLKADNARALAAVSAERDAMARRVRQLAALRSEIDHAPPSDDGPVAAVLSRALDGLRIAGSADGAGGEDRTAGDTGRPVDLRPGAGGPGG